MYFAGSHSQEYSSEGSQFFLGFGLNNPFNTDTAELILTVTTSEASPVNFTVTTLTEFSFTGAVTSSSSVELILPSALTVSSATVRDGGIQVRTVDPNKTIAVNGLNFEPRTSDAFLALPAHDYLVDQYKYVAVSMEWLAFPRQSTTVHLDSTILIVSTEDNTEITITPTHDVSLPVDLRRSGDTHTTIRAGVSYTVYLQKMQTYLLSSTQDLTGTVIVSNKPITVLGGHECAEVPIGIQHCDHMIEQIPPTLTWGQSFFTVVLNERGTSEFYRMVAAEDSTTVTQNCFSLDAPELQYANSMYIASPSDFKEITISPNMYCYLQADKQIFVAQYDFGNEITNDYGDPSMISIIPNEQFTTNSTIMFNAYRNFSNFITVIVQQKVIPTDIEVDNGILSGQWRTLYCSEGEVCAYVQLVPVSIGAHSVSFSGTFAVYVHGLESSRGYGYPAAMALKCEYTHRVGWGWGVIVTSESVSVTSHLLFV